MDHWNEQNWPQNKHQKGQFLAEYHIDNKIIMIGPKMTWAQVSGPIRWLPLFRKPAVLTLLCLPAANVQVD